METKQEQKKIKTATERLSDLELIVAQHHAGLQLLQEALQGIITQVAKEAGDLSSETRRLTDNAEALLGLLVDQGVVSKTNFEERKSQAKMQHLISEVNRLVDEDIIEKTNGPVEDANFIVMEERRPDGSVFSPRTQLLVNSLDAETKAKVLGAQIGQEISLGEGRTTVVVQEIYQMKAKQEQGTAE